MADGTTIDYIIDGQNHRIGKKVNSVLKHGLLWQDQLKPIAELDDNGNPISRYVYATGINLPNYLIKEGKTYRMITDHLGSLRLVVNVGEGTIAERVDYDEFGNVLKEPKDSVHLFGFAGGIYDSSTGLTRFGARDYNPELGRWTSKDPYGLKASTTNLYAYTISDPINRIDPNGLSAEFWGGFIVQGLCRLAKATQSRG